MKAFVLSLRSSSLEGDGARSAQGALDGFIEAEIAQAHGVTMRGS